jgi:hypothetical protein
MAKTRTQKRKFSPAQIANQRRFAAMAKARRAAKVTKPQSAATPKKEAAPMANKSRALAPRVSVTLARPSKKTPHKSSSGGKWTRYAKFAGALFGVGVLAYAARVLFPQSSALGRFLVTGAAGVALAAAFGTFKGTRSFATSYVMPAAIAMAALDGGATVAQEWGETLAGKLRGTVASVNKPAAPAQSKPAAPAQSKPAAPSSAEQNGSFAYQVPAAPPPPPPAPAAPKQSSGSSSAQIISALIGAAGQVGGSLIAAYGPKGSAGIVEEMAVQGSGAIDAQSMADLLFA